MSKEIIIHHSLTKDGKVVDTKAIRRYHKKKGCRDVGYNFLIERVGDEVVIFEGRPISWVGAHTRGRNRGTIGVCCIGNYDIDLLPYDIFIALKGLIKKLWAKYGEDEINPHSKYPDPETGYRKSCPGKLFPLDALRMSLGLEVEIPDAIDIYKEKIIGSGWKKREGLRKEPIKVYGINQKIVKK